MGPFDQRYSLSCGPYSDGHITQWGSWAPGSSEQVDAPLFYPELMEAYHANYNQLVHHDQMTRTTESRTRLSKEEVEMLEDEFQKNHKPNSITKKRLAEKMRVPIPRINNWFQNRRAREKKDNNIRQYKAKQLLEREKAEADAERQESDRKRDLVVSSAPFPQPRQSPQTKDRSPDVSEEPSPPDSAGDLNDTSSPPVISRRASELSLAFSHGEEDHHVKSPGQVIHGGFPMPCVDLDLSGNDTGFWDNFPEWNFNRKDSLEGPGKQLRLPVLTDLATRRNRQPPRLEINAMRGHVAGTDMRWGSERYSPMRRLHSASGPVRVTKQTATLRSPFLQNNKSPVTGGSSAPPTPDTPVVIVQGTNVSTPSDFVRKRSGSALGLDPTLTTPPTTPGLMDSVFSSGSGFNMAMSDGGFINSNMGGFELQSAATAASTLGFTAGAQSCSSQPVTPSQGLDPQTQAGYLGLAGSNAEFYWPDAHTSGRCSLGPNSQQAQFMDMLQHPIYFGHTES